MDNLNFKTNFVGKDGFVWWVGQIPDQEAWQTQIDEGKGSWGIRYKVRIMGYHPYDSGILSDEDLPWAQVLCPPGNSGSAGRMETIKLAQGDTVVGFFLDGHSAQIPIILGVFCKTPESERASTDTPSPFGNFTPYSKTITKDPDFVMQSVGSNSQGTGNEKEKVQESNSNITITQAKQQGKSCLLYTSPSPRD